ncbi:MAG: hypothetical protein VX278_18885 [Myxococcota bacterium]|nr:hypothetical protein [Myxococcota bacterium]
MGWLTRTFGRSEEAKIERAEILLSKGKYNDARLEITNVNHPKAIEILKKANRFLAQINLEQAEARFSAREYEAAQEHLELAAQFGASKDEIQNVRSIGRRFRTEHKNQEIKARQLKKAKKSERSFGDDPIWSLPDDDPRLRYAMRLEKYPLELRKRLISLGTGFAEATLMIEDGAPNIALEQLEIFIEKDPVARFEHARAALGCGQIHQAIADLLIFSEQVGHTVIDNVHTGALLSQLLAQTGESDKAMHHIQSLKNNQDDHPAISMIQAQIFESRNQLPEAEREITALMKRIPKNLSLIKQLARIKMKQNERATASNVLENGLKQCCTPGTCGSQPLDVNMLRMLAQIYLEDRQQQSRALELLSDIQRLSPSPTWEDQYLSALAARNDGHPFSQRLSETLLSSLSPSDPRRQLVLRAFPA